MDSAGGTELLNIKVSAVEIDLALNYREMFILAVALIVKIIFN